MFIAVLFDIYCEIIISVHHLPKSVSVTPSSMFIDNDSQPDSHAWIKVSHTCRTDMVK